MIFYLMISLDEYSLQEKKKAKIDGTKNREERVSRHERMMVQHNQIPHALTPHTCSKFQKRLTISRDQQGERKRASRPGCHTATD
jgi:predicted NodU family carbamoyl transferase